MKNCPECRRTFAPRRIDQGYCSVACQKIASTRELTRARRLYRALYWWRLPEARRTGKGIAENLRFICREIRSWHEEDMLAQRRPPPPHDHMQDRGHQKVARKGGGVLKNIAAGMRIDRRDAA